MTMRHTSRKRDKKCTSPEWNMKNVESDIEDKKYKDGELLRTMVRTNYLGHLKRYLKKNLDKSRRCRGASERTLESIVDDCTSYLEEKALKKCAIAKLYQKSVSKTIDEIKRCTEKSKIFPALEDFIKKGKNSKPKFCTKDTQTEGESTRSSGGQSIDSNQARTLLEQIVLVAASTLNPTNEQTSVPVVSSTNISEVPLPPNTHPGLSNIMGHIPTTSTVVKSEAQSSLLSSEEQFPDLKCSLKEEPPERKPLHISMPEYVSEIPVPSAPMMLEPGSSLQPQVFDTSLDVSRKKFSVNVNGKVKEFTVKRKAQSLDDRLKELGLANDSDPGISDSFITEERKTKKHKVDSKDGTKKHKVDSKDDTKKHKVDSKDDSFDSKLPNFIEAVALSCSIEHELNVLPEKLRNKIEESYERIFGPDHVADYYRVLSDDQKEIACRKRIASFVVPELTYYYKKKKIVSKPVFKAMAKHITSVIYNAAIYPDHKFVSDYIKQFFLGGKVISKEADFQL